MMRTRRHKYFQLSVFFLIYTIIHEVSSSETNTKSELEKSLQQSEDNKVTQTPGHEQILKHLDAHLNSAVKGKNFSEPQNFTAEGHHHVLNTLDKHLSSIAGRLPPNEKNNSLTANNSTAHHDIVNIIDKHVAHVSKGAQSEKNVSTKAHNITGHETVGNTLDKQLMVAIGGVPKGAENLSNETDEEDCTPPAIRQFPHPLMSPKTRRHGGLIIHIIVAAYMFLGLAIVCDEYFVASLDRICE
ncbi:unnamed protein product, partial [Phaedon cochleariae]